MLKAVWGRCATSWNADSKLMQEDENHKVFQYIEEWKSRLIDLSRRNRLLYFKHTRYGNLSVSSPDAETVFSRLISRKRNLEFWLPPDEPIDLQTEDTTASLTFPGQPQKPT